MYKLLDFTERKGDIAVIKEMIIEADMRTKKLREDGRDVDFTERKGDIADPWYTGNFDLTYGDVLDGCRGLLKFIEEQESV